MKGITIDLAAAHALQSLTPRTVALIASIPDLDVPISSSDWTLGEAAVHLVFGARDYSEHARGAQRCYRINPADTAGNHDELASIAQRDRPALDTELQLGIDAFLDATEGRTAEDLLPWHVGSLSCASMTGLLLGEQLLHGYDMAQTLDAEWPIEAEPARLVVEAWLPLLPRLVDSAAVEGIAVSYELIVDGGPSVIARFCDGVSIDLSEDGPVDCRLSGDPISWLLALYGRVGWENLLRTGGVKMTYGDTALGAGFKRLLRNP